MSAGRRKLGTEVMLSAREAKIAHEAIDLFRCTDDAWMTPEVNALADKLCDGADHHYDFQRPAQPQGESQ